MHNLRWRAYSYYIFSELINPARSSDVLVTMLLFRHVERWFLSMRRLKHICRLQNGAIIEKKYNNSLAVPWQVRMLYFAWHTFCNEWNHVCQKPISRCLGRREGEHAVQEYLPGRGAWPAGSRHHPHSQSGMPESLRLYSLLRRHHPRSPPQIRRSQR